MLFRSNPRSYLPGYRYPYLILAGLGWAGLIVSRRSGGDWTPVYLAMGALTLVHVLIITSARFRIPMELLLIPAAAAAGELAVVRLAAVFSRRPQFSQFSRSSGGGAASL